MLVGLARFALTAALWILLSTGAQAQYNPASQPLGSTPDVVLLNQGSGCPTNTAPCATVTSPSLRFGQPIQQNCLAIIAPFQYQQCINTTLTTATLFQYIGTTWFQLWTLDPTVGPIINGALIVGTSAVVNGTSNCIFYNNSSILGCSTALANGTTATTQSQGDDSTLVATDLFVRLGIGYVDAWGAKCDGSTNDSAAFTSSIAVNGKAVFPVGAPTCLVQNLSITNGTHLDLNGGVLAPYPGATTLLKLTSAAVQPLIENGTIADSSHVLLSSTILANTASRGNTTIIVSNATPFAIGKQLTVTLDSGARWPTQATNIAGTTITIASAIPDSVTAVTVGSTTGTACQTGDTFVVATGTGAPATLTATASAGHVSAFTVEAPGFYTADPTTTNGALSKGAVNHCTGTLPTANLTVSGASSGNTVKTGYPLIWSNGAYSPKLSHLTLTGDFNMQFDNATANFDIDHVVSVATQVGAYFYTATGAPNNTGVIQASTFNGLSPPNFGVAGAFFDGGTGVATGIYVSDTTSGQAEEGFIANTAVQFFVNDSADGDRNYGFLLRGGTNRITSTHTGATYGSESSVASQGYGIGVASTGNAATPETYTSLRTALNAADVYSESGQVIQLDPFGWGPETIVAGSGAPQGPRLPYTPTDQSGSSLTFTSPLGNFQSDGQYVRGGFSLTYPSDAVDTATAEISLPVTVSSIFGSNATTTIGSCQNTTGSFVAVFATLGGTSKGYLLNAGTNAVIRNQDIQTNGVVCSFQYPM